MPYSDNGDVQGLLTRCKNANILEKSSRRDKETLAKKLYILEVKKDKEKAIQYGPTRTIPKQTNSTALAVYDLLTSPERCALVMGHLITRIRPKDEQRKKGSISKDALSRMAGFLQGTHHKHVYAVTTKLPAIVCIHAHPDIDDIET